MRHVHMVAHEQLKRMRPGFEREHHIALSIAEVNRVIILGNRLIQINLVDVNTSPRPRSWPQADITLHSNMTIVAASILTAMLINVLTQMGELDSILVCSTFPYVSGAPALTIR